MNIFDEQAERDAAFWAGRSVPGPVNLPTFWMASGAPAILPHGSLLTETTMAVWQRFAAAVNGADGEA